MAALCTATAESQQVQLWDLGPDPSQSNQTSPRGSRVLLPPVSALHALHRQAPCLSGSKKGRGRLSVCRQPSGAVGAGMGLLPQPGGEAAPRGLQRAPQLWGRRPGHAVGLCRGTGTNPGSLCPNGQWHHRANAAEQRRSPCGKGNGIYKQGIHGKQKSISCAWQGGQG